MSASDPRPTVYVPSTTVFKADIFKGKVLFCTGGGSGICQTMTRDVMMHGANAVIVGRKQNKLDESCKWLEEQCKAQGVDSKVIGVSADVRKPEELKKAAQKVSRGSQRSRNTKATSGAPADRVSVPSDD